MTKFEEYLIRRNRAQMRRAKVKQITGLIGDLIGAITIVALPFALLWAAHIFN
jgi:hypothetical protein